LGEKPFYAPLRAPRIFAAFCLRPFCARAESVFSRGGTARPRRAAGLLPVLRFALLFYTFLSFTLWIMVRIF
jgi:hypothetical protein